jgi:hypothetical protein
MNLRSGTFCLVVFLKVYVEKTTEGESRLSREVDVEAPIWYSSVKLVTPKMT